MPVENKIKFKELTEHEQRIAQVLRRLLKTNPRPTSEEIGEEAGYSQPRASQIMQLLKARGALKDISRYELTVNF